MPLLESSLLVFVFLSCGAGAASAAAARLPGLPPVDNPGVPALARWEEERAKAATRTNPLLQGHGQTQLLPVA